MTHEQQKKQSLEANQELTQNLVLSYRNSKITVTFLKNAKGCSGKGRQSV